ncbi:MAG: type II toxin-antitoxin system RelE/ParE family toxin [Planctomycetes bacterium]|nr:type II toxin-antitoxin system RelE/ParE family toxin [Planctomycetota bacterium]
MSYLVTLTDRAFEELDDACTWWETHRSPEQASRWYQGFIDALRSLSENPQRCALASENDLLVFEARQLNYGLGAKPTHRAVFVVRPNQVLVLRIRHLAQQNIIPDDFV